MRQTENRTLIKFAFPLNIVYFCDLRFSVNTKRMINGNSRGKAAELKGVSVQPVSPLQNIQEFASFQCSYFCFIAIEFCNILQPSLARVTYNRVFT